MILLLKWKKTKNKVAHFGPPQLVKQNGQSFGSNSFLSKFYSKYKK